MQNIYLLKVSVLVLISLYCVQRGTTQVTVFSDNFSTNQSTTWTTGGVIGMSPWTVLRSGDDWGARRNTSPAQLELTNDVDVIGNVEGWVLVSIPTSGFQSPYDVVLENNETVTWNFNMRQIRSDPSGFNAGNYGVAFILAGQNTGNITSGSGYAVVLGQTGTVDNVRLVRYTGGFDANTDLTNIVTGLNDFGAQYLSIRVIYRSCTDRWELFVRNDGITAFADPQSGTLTSQGTATDNTFTSVSLNMMAAYWLGSTASNQTAFFDNVTVETSGCLPAPSMEWVLLNGGESNGNCISETSCEDLQLCYGLVYTPNVSGTLLSYTTGFFINCNDGINPIISNTSCTLTDFSNEQAFCAQVNAVLFNSSGQFGTLSISQGVPVLLHQVCFGTSETTNLTITEDNSTDLSTNVLTPTGAGPEFPAYSTYIIDHEAECTLLPLTWLDFEVQRAGNLTSRLLWKTADEIANAYFEIERRTGDDDDFIVIGRTETTESQSSALNTYTFFDRNARHGQNAYRIRQVDEDGKSTFSPIRSIVFDSPEFAVRALPNPSSDAVEINIQNALESGSIILLNSTGQYLWSAIYPAGTSSMNIPVHDMPSGLYSLLLNDNSHQYVERIVVAH